MTTGKEGNQAGSVGRRGRLCFRRAASSPRADRFERAGRVALGSGSLGRGLLAASMVGLVGRLLRLTGLQAGREPLVRSPGPGRAGARLDWICGIRGWWIIVLFPQRWGLFDGPFPGGVKRLGTGRQ